MTNRLEVSFAARDNVELAGTLHMAASPKAYVLICSATGLRQQFYWNFAEWLTTQDFGVLTFDYRGIGASLDGKSPRDCSARKQDWGQLDMPAAIEFLGNRFPSSDIHFLGIAPVGS